MRLILASLFLFSGGAWGSYLNPSSLVQSQVITGPAALNVPEDYRPILTFYAALTSDLTAFGRGSQTATYTRNSIATYISPTTGYITQVAANVPRFEANGYLSEGARTNSLVFSNSPNGAGWVNANCTVTQFSDTSPDGTVNAHLVGAVANGASLYQPITLASAAYTGSIYMKRKTGTGAVYLAVNASTATGWNAVTITTTAYTRVTRTETVLNPVFGISFQTAGDDVYIYGGQGENGAFASSYVPTTNAAVVRVIDSLTFVGTGNATSAMGTGMGTAYLQGTSAAEYVRVLSFSNGAAVSSPAVLHYTRQPRIYDGTTYAESGLAVVGLMTSTRVGGIWGGTKMQALSGSTLGNSQNFDGAMETAVLYIGRDDYLNNNLYGNTSRVICLSVPLTSWELSLIH